MNRADRRRNKREVQSMTTTENMVLTMRTTLALALYAMVHECGMKKKDAERVVREVGKGFNYLSAGYLEMEKDIVQDLIERVGIDVREIGAD